MSNKKIESVIDSCSRCKHMLKMKEIAGNTFFAGICAYGLSEGKMDKSPPFTIVATSTSKDVFDNEISIPENCPLETYSEKQKNT